MRNATRVKKKKKIASLEDHGINREIVEALQEFLRRDLSV